MRKKCPGIPCFVFTRNPITKLWVDAHHTAYLRVVLSKSGKQRYVAMFVPSKPSKGIPELRVGISIPVLVHLSKILLRHRSVIPLKPPYQNIFSDIEIYLNYNNNKSSSSNSSSNSGSNNGSNNNDNSNTNSSSNNNNIVDKKRVRDFLMGKRTAHTIWIDSDIWQRFKDIVPPDKDSHWAIEQLMKDKLKEAEDARNNSAKGAEGV